MPRVSVKHEDCNDPIKELGQKLVDYITAKSGVIDRVFNEPNSKGQLTVIRDIDGDETKFLTMPLDGRTEEPDESVEGLFSLEELLDKQIEKPEPVIEDLVNEKINFRRICLTFLIPCKPNLWSSTKMPEEPYRLTTSESISVVTGPCRRILGGVWLRSRMVEGRACWVSP